MAWVLDLDGVVWLGSDPIPGAADAIARLRAAGEDVLFVTNASFRPVGEVEAQLADCGIDGRGRVLTSAVMAVDLVDPGETVLVAAGPGVSEELQRRGAVVVTEGEADAVMVGFHLDFTYDRMRAASLAVRNGARLLATNDDATYPTPEGLWPGGGAILASIERATGTDAVVAGKPYPPSVEHVHRRVGTTGIMVGDRPDTDGRFARALGYDFGLVLSGVTAPADLPVEPQPDVIGVDLGALVEETLGADGA
jgi:4-nitrophenyl phosphatase